MLLDFIIIGAPKAGTTSLYHYISEHPDIFMSDPKEVNFLDLKEINFSHESIKHNQFSLPRNRFVRKLYSYTVLRKSLSSIFSYSFRNKIRKLLFREGPKPKISQALKRKLLDIYTPDILKLNEMIKQDVSIWLKADD